MLPDVHNKTLNKLGMWCIQRIMDNVADRDYP